MILYFKTDSLKANKSKRISVTNKGTKNKKKLIRSTFKYFLLIFIKLILFYDFYIVMFRFILINLIISIYFTKNIFFICIFKPHS